MKVWPKAPSSPLSNFSDERMVDVRLRDPLSDVFSPPRPYLTAIKGGETLTPLVPSAVGRSTVVPTSALSKQSEVGEENMELGWLSSIWSRVAISDLEKFHISLKFSGV